MVAKVGNYERIYGEENPIFSIEYEGFAGNDSESSLSAKPTAKSPATITSNVGTYPINVSGGDATNYKFSYTSGVLTINECRAGRTVGDYDVVIGGIANDKVFRTVDLYYAGEINKEECLRRLIFEEPNNQICIRTQRVLDECLTYKSSQRL